MKDQIFCYLSGPRPYHEGVALYETYGPNAVLKMNLRRLSESELLRNTLMEELRKLAGLSETAFRTMKRRAVLPNINENSNRFPTHFQQVSNIPDTPVVPMQQTAQPVSETTQKVIRFRERFPFLNDPDCPDVLKVLVADMFTAHDLYVRCFRELTELPDDVEVEHALSISKSAVESHLENRLMWEELEHYRDRGSLLGRHRLVADWIEGRALQGKTDLEVERVRTNASSNLSKWKTKLAKAATPEERAKAEETLRRWEQQKAAAEAELERRRKR